MSFQCPAGTTFFTAIISDLNAAFLDGTTVPLAEYASVATNLPPDLDLWHRRLAHHHYEGIKKLLKKKLITGMTLDSSVVPDPIYEPYLAGRMYANPFPCLEWRASGPLELVHSDDHQVPYPSLSGYHYWVTFIDSYSRFHFMLPITAKSDVFDAFKQFKAYAENQSGHKIKILRDDKGVEYMSNAFSKFIIDCGIERQYTGRAWPQQKGVAEKTNSVLSEHLTTMLDESRLPCLPNGVPPKCNAAPCCPMPSQFHATTSPSAHPSISYHSLPLILVLNPIHCPSAHPYTMCNKYTINPSPYISLKVWQRDMKRLIN